MCPKEERQISVLVAEDHPPLRELIAALLNDAGYHVTTAATGDEALRIANETQVDLLLTDLRMPGLSGSSLIDQFQAQSRNSGVVVMSGDGGHPEAGGPRAVPAKTLYVQIPPRRHNANPERTSVLARRTGMAGGPEELTPGDR